MINNVAKWLKNVNSLIQAEIAAWHTSHDRNEKIHCYLPRIYQENCDKKNTKLLKMWIPWSSAKSKWFLAVIMPRLLRAKVVGGRRNPCGKQKLKKNKKNAFSKKACGHATQKRSGKPRVCELKSKNLEVTPNVPKAFFSSKKLKTCFLRDVRTYATQKIEKCREHWLRWRLAFAGKVGKSWFLYNDNFINFVLLGKRTREPKNDARY